MLTPRIIVYAVAGCAALSSVLPALARPQITQMSCDGARGLVARSGAILLGTGGHTFDRYVVHRGFSTPLERVEPAYVPTRNGSCLVGYTCEQTLNPDDAVRD